MRYPLPYAFARTHQLLLEEHAPGDYALCVHGQSNASGVSEIKVRGPGTRPALIALRRPRSTASHAAGRTLALVGQAGSGKTTLAEALLAAAGAIPAAGSIERGTTVCDYTPIEKQLRHSLKLAVASFEARGALIGWPSL